MSTDALPDNVLFLLKNGKFVSMNVRTVENEGRSGSR